MAKKLSEKEKLEIIKNFSNGKTIDQLADQFNCAKLTISRNLKKSLGEQTYKDLVKKIKNHNKIKNLNKESINTEIESQSTKENRLNENQLDNSFFQTTPFTEIVPLNCEIDNNVQKDLSSVNISDINLPKIVYMIVSKQIELETKYLRDYPEWQFLSEQDLNRKTIEIFFENKIAKRFCNKEQKVIKVPNTYIFKLVAPILVSKGITRIVTAENLISL